MCTNCLLPQQLAQETVCQVVQLFYIMMYELKNYTFTELYTSKNSIFVNPYIFKFDPTKLLDTFPLRTCGQLSIYQCYVLLLMVLHKSNYTALTFKKKNLQVYFLTQLGVLPPPPHHIKGFQGYVNSFKCQLKMLPI